MVAGSNSSVRMPPAVTCALSKPSVPRTGSAKPFAARTSALSSLSVTSPSGRPPGTAA